MSSLGEDGGKDAIMEEAIEYKSLEEDEWGSLRVERKIRGVSDKRQGILGMWPLLLERVSGLGDSGTPDRMSCR